MTPFNKSRLVIEDSSGLIHVYESKMVSKSQKISSSDSQRGTTQLNQTPSSATPTGTCRCRPVFIRRGLPEYNSPRCKRADSGKPRGREGKRGNMSRANRSRRSEAEGGEFGKAVSPKFGVMAWKLRYPCSFEILVCVGC